MLFIGQFVHPVGGGGVKKRVDEGNPYISQLQVSLYKSVIWCKIQVIMNPLLYLSIAEINGQDINSKNDLVF